MWFVLKLSAWMHDRAFAASALAAHFSSGSMTEARAAGYRELVGDTMPEMSDAL